jgi:hypothetical protein
MEKLKVKLIGKRHTERTAKWSDKMPPVGSEFYVTTPSEARVASMDSNDFYMDEHEWLYHKKDLEFLDEIQQKFKSASETAKVVAEKTMERLNSCTCKSVFDPIDPSHYKQYPIEIIDMMVKVFGKERVADYCLVNAYKYRMRMGLKPGQPVEQDLEKEKWYLKKYNELKS